MKYAVRLGIARTKSYCPGFKPDPNENYIKLNSNKKPYPLSPRVGEVLRTSSYEDLHFYPDSESMDLRKRLGGL